MVVSGEMKPVFQTIFKPPLGNCQQAAVASILELPLEAVPNFAEAGNAWLKSYQEFLHGLGLGLISVQYSKEMFEMVQGWHIMVVKSPRGDYAHALVAYNGEPKHDPYPDGKCAHRGVINVELFTVMDAARASGGVLK